MIFLLGRYEKALSDCHLALAQLRNNSVIDYKQLGLRHLLFTWEVGIGLCNGLQVIFNLQFHISLAACLPRDLHSAVLLQKKAR